MSALFNTRREAGRQLAELLEQYRSRSPLVLGIPGGGVLVGDEVANALGAQLAIAEVVPGGAGRGARSRARRRPGRAMLDTAQPSAVGPHMADRRQTVELPDVFGRTVIVTDDGLHAEEAIIAVIEALRVNGARHVVVATPMLSRSAADRYGHEAHAVVSLKRPEQLQNASSWYEDARSPTPEEIRALVPAVPPPEAAKQVAGVYRAVLVPTDFSAVSQRALQHALRLVAPEGELVVLHVLMGGDLIDTRQRLQELVESFPAETTPLLMLRQGDSAAEILMQVEDGLHDLVVMGTHGRRGLERLVLGSVAARVIRESPVPVMVVPD